MRLNAYQSKKYNEIAAELAEYSPRFWNFKDGVLAVKTTERITTDVAGCILICSNPHNEGFVTKFKV